MRKQTSYAELSPFSSIYFVFTFVNILKHFQATFCVLHNYRHVGIHICPIRIAITSNRKFNI